MSLWFLLPTPAIGKITVSGETGISDTIFGAVSVSLNTDGTIDKVEGVTNTQIDAATDWVIPNILGSTGRHQAKWSMVSGDTPDTGNMSSADTWYDLGSVNRTVGYSAGPGASKSGTITIAVGVGGNVVSQNDYTMFCSQPPE